MLRGALDAAAQRNRPIWLVGCPYAPNGPELARIGLAKHVRWVKTESPADAQWACETILRSNALGALVAWLPRARPEGIRRLQGLVAATDALAFAIRSASAANDASASPLRIALEPAPGGFVRAQILKRRGPAASNTLLLPLGSLAHVAGISGGNRRQVQVQPSSESSQVKDNDRNRAAEVADVAGVTSENGEYCPVRPIVLWQTLAPSRLCGAAYRVA
jgi:protein ImuA